MSEQLNLTPDEARAESEASVQEHNGLSDIAQESRLAYEGSVSESDKELLSRAAETSRNNLAANVEGNRTKTETELVAVTDEPLAQAAESIKQRVFSTRDRLLDANKAIVAHYQQTHEVVDSNLPAFKQAAIEDAKNDGVTIDKVA